MPLDAADYEKIQAIIDRVVNPLVSKVDTIYGGLMPRVEYEKSHKHIEQAAIDNRIDIRDLRNWVYNELEKLRLDNDAIKKDMQIKHDEVMQSINDLKNDISTQRITTIRYMVGVAVGIVIAIVIPILFKVYGG